MTQQSILVSVKSHSSEPTSGEVVIENFTPAQRRRRALKTLGIWWGVALVTIPIPLVHFVVPPLFIICGPIFALFAARRLSIIISGSATCPLCLETFDVVKNPPNWPMDDVCSKCHQHVEISAA